MLAERFFSRRDEARRLEAGCCAAASRFASGLDLGFDSGFTQDSSPALSPSLSPYSG